MKTLISFLLITSICWSCGSGLKPNEIHDPIFNWTIAAPRGFRKVVKPEILDFSNGNVKILTGDFARSNFTECASILAFTDSNKCYLSAIGQPYDEKKDGPFHRTFTTLSRELAEVYTVALADFKMEVSDGKQQFNNQTFLEYNVRVFLPKDTFQIDLFGKQFGNKILLVQLHYDDRQAGDAMRRAFVSSTFD